MKNFAIALIILAFAIITLKTAYAEPVQPPECPKGSYSIGITKDNQPLCKLEPTGCPYGDSIPVDSPKCTPPTQPEAYTPWEPEQPTQEMQGK